MQRVTNPFAGFVKGSEFVAYGMEVWGEINIGNRIHEVLRQVKVSVSNVR